MRGGAAGDRDLADALRAQMLGGEAADLAGADDQHAPAIEAAEDLPRQRDRRKTDRHRAFAKRGLGPYTFADAERPTKELAEHRPCAAASRRRLERALHLAENLRFANNQRIETGRDAEEMLGGGFVAQREQVWREAVGGQRMVLTEEFDDLVACARRVVAGDVDLGPVAWGQHDRLGRRRPSGQ